MQVIHPLPGDHLLAHKVLHWDGAYSPGDLDAQVIVIDPDPLGHPIFLVDHLKLVIEDGRVLDDFQGVNPDWISIRSAKLSSSSRVQKSKA